MAAPHDTLGAREPAAKTVEIVAAADPKAAHHGGSKFPPFDPATFAPQLIWLAISFGFLYLVMSRIALPRVASVLAERRERIQRDLGEAERLKAETDAALQSYEKSLSDARSRAQSMAKETRERVAADMDRERRRVDDANAAKIADTEAQIAKTKAAALANVESMAAETASAIVERLAGQQVSVDELRHTIASQRSRVPA